MNRFFVLMIPKDYCGRRYVYICDDKEQAIKLQKDLIEMWPDSEIIIVQEVENNNLGKNDDANHKTRNSRRL